MAEFDSLLDCTLGTTSFQLSDYSYKEEAVVEEGKGKTGAKITITGDGYVSEASAAAFSAALLATQAGFRSSGQNFYITGLGGNYEVIVLAAQCVDGGPHCSFEMLAQGDGVALVKPFRFTLTATTTGSSDPSNTDPTNSYKTTISTRPDGLREVSINGELVGKGCSDFYEDTVLPFFEGLYPVAAWVPVLSFERNQQDDRATYTLRFVELAASFAIVPGATIVDGEVTSGDERDEQMRLVRNVSYDLLVDGDPIKVRDQIRGLLPATPIREQFEVTAHKEIRVRGTFVVLLTATRAAEGLLNWEQELEVERGERFKVEVEESPVLDPLLYQAQKVATVIMQRGSATGLGKFIKEGAILFPEDLQERPRITYKVVNDFERLTTWEYKYVFASPPTLDGAVLAKLARPAAPEFK